MKFPDALTLITIGVYGFTEESFFEALENAGVQVFFDIRWRRGVRGAEYAFANSKRLQNRLEAMGILYIHRQELAPSPDIRQVQYEADAAGKTAKRKRSSLSPEFITTYQEKVLKGLDLQALIEDVPQGTRVAALFCVEKLPEACHRSLVAEEYHRAFGTRIEHIIPQ